MAAMPSKVLLGGGNGLSGEVMAVHAPINSKCPNVRGGEAPRLWLSAGGEVAPDEGLGGQALDLTPNGVRRHRIASGYAVGTKRRRASGAQSMKKEGLHLGGAL